MIRTKTQLKITFQSFKRLKQSLGNKNYRIIEVFIQQNTDRQRNKNAIVEEDRQRNKNTARL